MAPACADRRAAAAAAGLVRGEAGPDATLSISHVMGRAVAAAAPAGRLVGVDLERHGRAVASELRLFALPAESRAIEDPTTLWALKEAAWKALHCARSLPFHALELMFDGAGAVSGVRVEEQVHVAAARVWQPWRGWVAAVVEVRA